MTFWLTNILTKVKKVIRTIFIHNSVTNWDNDNPPFWTIVLVCVWRHKLGKVIALACVRYSRGKFYKIYPACNITNSKLTSVIPLLSLPLWLLSLIKKSLFQRHYKEGGRGGKLATSQISVGVLTLCFPWSKFQGRGDSLSRKLLQKDMLHLPSSLKEENINIWQIWRQESINKRRVR